MTFVNQVSKYIIDDTPYLLFVFCISISLLLFSKMLIRKINFDSRKKYFYGIFYDMSNQGMLLLSCWSVKVLFTLYFILTNVYLNVTYLFFLLIILIIVVFSTKSSILFLKEIIILILMYIVLIFLMSLKEYLLYLGFDALVFIVMIVFVILLMFVFILNLYFYLKKIISSEELYD